MTASRNALRLLAAGLTLAVLVAAQPARTAEPTVPDNLLRETQATVPEALYRDGQPPVLTPPDKAPAEAADDSATIAGYRAAYTAQKRPRVAVYWNRALSDRITQWFQPERMRLQEDFDVRMQANRRELEHSGRTARTVGPQYQRTDAERPGMSELAQMAFEDGFYGPYLEAGTKLIDRAAILRLARNDMPKRLQDDNVPDIQVLETEALRDYADLLLEVLLIPDNDAVAGFTFRVVVKRVLTGEIVASHISRIEEKDDADVDTPKGKLVPGPGGFHRETPEQGKIDVRGLGRRLALETMQVMSRLPGA